MLENKDESCGTQGPCGTPELGIGESVVEQAAPTSTIARERFIEIIANNTKVIADAQAMLELINQDPQLDASMCRLFGITSKPVVRDVR